ncbi:MAG: VTT domain-containing protein [Candidatus Shapirobacteria bacterium]
MLLHHHLRRRRHSNLLLLLGGISAAVIFSRLPFFTTFIEATEKFGYLGAIVSGFLFTSTFTAATSGLLLINFAKFLDPFWLIVCAAIGALTSDLLIFRFVKNKVAEDITPVYEHFITKNHLHKIVHTKYFSWTLPVIGAMIMATPLPDELGVSLLGLSHMSFWKFFLVSLLSHSVAMFILVSAALLAV